jgi:hypothetical protein
MLNVEGLLARVQKSNRLRCIHLWPRFKPAPLPMRNESGFSKRL